jgi:putative tryptophan/tyrosine transport system substrate-binding protein
MLGGCGLASTWPSLTWSHRPSALRRVGYLSLQHHPQSLESDPNGEFLRAMNKLGYSEGKSLLMEWRFAELKEDRLPQLATELVNARVDVIVATTAEAVRAAQRATTAIPITMAIAGNPVLYKLVPSLSNPTGNTTGVSSADPDRLPKQLEYLSMVVPSLKRVAYLRSRIGYQGPLPVPKQLADLASKLQISIRAIEASGMDDVKHAFALMKDESVQALIQGSNPILNELRSPIASLALENRIASITTRREFVAAGGLMSYGESLSDFYHRTAKCVDRILKGAKPSELPVELPTRISLDLNQRTATTLGLSFPAQLQVLADSILE